jgi:hypothetical protein
VWVAKLVVALLCAGIALWLGKRAWWNARPEKAVVRLEAKLLQNLRNNGSGKMLIADWISLCDLVKKGITERDSALAQSGMEAAKLFVGEYFRGNVSDGKLTISIYRELASMYAAAIKQKPEFATEVIIALRVAAREMLTKNEVVFIETMHQFTVYGLLALREKQTFITSKILDQLFLLAPKCTDDALQKQQQALLEAISTIAQGAVKRQDVGLVREIITCLLDLKDTMGTKVHDPVKRVLLKAVRFSSAEIIDLTLEASGAVLASEQEDEVCQTIRVWSEAAKNALLTQKIETVRNIIVQLNQVVLDRLTDDRVIRACLDEIFAVVGIVFRGKKALEYGELLIPVLELGRHCMQRELKQATLAARLKSHRFILKYVLDKLLHLGAVVTRDGEVTMGVWVLSLHAQWQKLPENTYRKDSILRFVQLWLLYWMNIQRRTATRQGGIPHELFGGARLSKDDVAHFPDLHIRSLEI